MLDKPRDDWVIRFRDIGNWRVVNLISHDAQANDLAAHPYLDGALLQEVAVDDQLARKLDKDQGGVAFEDLPHDWQNLIFDQWFPLEWRDGGGWLSLTADVVTDYLPDGVER